MAANEVFWSIEAKSTGFRFESSLFGDAEINQVEVALVVEDEVWEFDVSMSKAFRMNILQRLKNSSTHKLNLVHSKPQIFIIIEIATAYEVHNNIQIISILKSMMDFGHKAGVDKQRDFILVCDFGLLSFIHDSGF